MTKKNILIFSLIILMFGLFVILIPEISYANGDTGTTKLTNPLGTTSIPNIIGRIIRGLLGIVGSVALLMFVYGGFTLLTSGGSSDKVKKGKDILVWATIGIVFIFISFLSVNFIINSLTGLSDEEKIEETNDVEPSTTEEEAYSGPCTTTERESGGRCLCSGRRSPYLTTSGDCVLAGCSWSTCE